MAAVGQKVNGKALGKWDTKTTVLERGLKRALTSKEGEVLGVEALK